MTSAVTSFASIGIDTLMTDGDRPDRRVRVVDWRPEWAQRFEDERVRLAGVFEDNREGYTEAKSSFIENALATTQPTEPNV